jgi:hypothetical protein
MMEQVILARLLEAFLGVIHRNVCSDRPLLGALGGLQGAPFGSWRQLSIK